MRSFKFFNNYLTKAHDGGWIIPNEWFYTVAKMDYWLTYPSGKRKLTKKYSIAPRYIATRYKDKFKPDHELFWYFRSEENAKWLVNLWKRQDDFVANLYGDLINATQELNFKITRLNNETI